MIAFPLNGHSFRLDFSATIDFPGRAQPTFMLPLDSTKSVRTGPARLTHSATIFEMNRFQ